MIPGPHPHGQLSQIPLPGPAAPQDKPNTGLPHTAPPVGVPPPTSEANLPGLSEAMLRVSFRVPPGMHPQGECKLRAVRRYMNNQTPILSQYTTYQAELHMGTLQ